MVLYWCSSVVHTRGAGCLQGCWGGNEVPTLFAPYIATYIPPPHSIPSNALDNLVTVPPTPPIEQYSLGDPAQWCAMSNTRLHCTQQVYSVLYGRVMLHFSRPHPLCVYAFSLAQPKVVGWRPLGSTPLWSSRGAGQGNWTSSRLHKTQKPWQVHTAQGIDQLGKV